VPSMRHRRGKYTRTVTPAFFFWEVREVEFEWIELEVLTAYLLHFSSFQVLSMLWENGEMQTCDQCVKRWVCGDGG
jgi:hypothetical protein